MCGGEGGAGGARGPSSIPGWGTKIPQASRCGQKKKKLHLHPPVGFLFNATFEKLPLLRIPLYPATKSAELNETGIVKGLGDSLFPLTISGKSLKSKKKESNLVR